VAVAGPSSLPGPGMTRFDQRDTSPSRAGVEGGARQGARVYFLKMAAPRTASAYDAADWIPNVIGAGTLSLAISAQRKKMREALDPGRRPCCWTI